MGIDWSKAPGWADRALKRSNRFQWIFGDNEKFLAVGGKIVKYGEGGYYDLNEFEFVEMRPIDKWKEGEKRMNNIAQNGNDGHYERKVVEHDKKNKYSRKIKTISLGNVDHAIYADVYDVLTAFEVVNPAMAHAVKKMLAPGQRGAKGTIQDMKEAVESIERAIELEAGDNDK